MSVVLEAEPFNIIIQDKRYYSDGFKIKQKEIIHLSCQSDFNAQNLLYLIAGLHLERNLTSPNNDESKIERQNVEIPKENLSFIKFDGSNLYDISK
ncbi:MAG: hypothetical protein IPL63_13870 [Saprospiraceae bacterium]|nr:hypothetical protein [Saprospiraceae bacterium]